MSHLVVKCYIHNPDPEDKSPGKMVRLEHLFHWRRCLHNLTSKVRKVIAIRIPFASKLTGSTQLTTNILAFITSI